MSITIKPLRIKHLTQELQQANDAMYTSHLKHGGEVRLHHTHYTYVNGYQGEPHLKDTRDSLFNALQEEENRGFIHS